MVDVKQCVEVLRKNPDSVFTETARILIKIADNILTFPHTDKVRALQKSNEMISKKILNVSGGVDCLIAMGFQENDLHFKLPMGKSLDKLESVKFELIKQQNKDEENVKEANVFAGLIEDDQSEEEVSDDSSSDGSENSKIGVVKIPANVPKVALPPFVNIFSHAFLRTIEQFFHRSLSYEDKQLHERARHFIPIVQLEHSAQDRLRAIQERIKKGEITDPNISLQDLLILELLHWFKNDFFSWVDCPSCDKCGKGTKFVGMSKDSSHFIHTNRIEVFSCDSCQNHTHFPRYDDVNILLLTRRGRCGEWANTFTLLCRAMGWDARFVVDSTDHVWTEVYSFAQKRWIHCDPCENLCDTPLVYESGWGKKFSYVIAYSAEEVQDVTWRYSSNHKEVLRRRNQFAEVQLIDALIQLREIRQSQLSVARREYLTKRLTLELVELMVERQPNEADMQGRISGSYAWRISRGETQENVANSHVWKLKPDPTANTAVTIRYCCSKNIYEYIPSEGEKEVLKGWNTGCFQITNIFRKEEKDWQMVYLARTEGSNEGKIIWKYEVVDCAKTIDTIMLQLNYQTYENGSVTVKLCSENNCIDVGTRDLSCFRTNLLSGSKWVTVVVELSGGKGIVGWQHTQLFRQSVKNDDFPFLLQFTFK